MAGDGDLFYVTETPEPPGRTWSKHACQAIPSSSGLGLGSPPSLGSGNVAREMSRSRGDYVKPAKVTRADPPSPPDLGPHVRTNFGLDARIGLHTGVVTSGKRYHSRFRGLVTLHIVV